MFKDIFKKIKKYNTIVIARHIGVDPDALGAQIGLKESIKKTFPEKNVYAVGSKSSRYNYFPKMDKLDDISKALLIVLDTPDKKRVDIGDFSPYVYKIKIDHHPYIEAFCDIELINDTASSASELVLDLINNTKLVLDREIAEYLFMGIISDTNRFLFNTTAKVLEDTTKLLKDFDLEVGPLYQNIYMRPLSEFRFQGYVASNMIITKNGLGYIKITPDILEEHNVDVSSAGNQVNNFNNIEDLLVWVTITEDVKNDLMKVNIRSRGPVINTIAERYHGGGHKFASGARIPRSNVSDVDELLNMLDDACKEYLEKESESNEY